MKKVLLNGNEEVITVEPEEIISTVLVEDKIVIGKANNRNDIYVIKEGTDKYGQQIMIAHSLIYDGLEIEYDNMKDLLMDYEVTIFDDYAELGLYLR